VSPLKSWKDLPLVNTLLMKWLEWPD
jgi:hypothetical protein